ncbi:hypothetical protein B4135_2800 [Caldibacillus debilis]|uniref:Uncharacterized protein n=1 Tax=Caldibacillus debilis TaxID=301148 RepID=A0A150LQ16_9BACI|nr:hypothetical protein B4135_2800 [Caldibacillus debilis]
MVQGKQAPAIIGNDKNVFVCAGPSFHFSLRPYEIHRS